MSSTTKKTPQSVLNSINKTLEKYNKINRYEYACFYRALGEQLSLNNQVRAIWQSSVIDYMIDKKGSIEDFYNEITSAIEVFPLRKTYPFIRPNFNGHCQKFFPVKTLSKNNRLENSIKFNLINNRLDPFGKFITYELPLFQTNNTGGIDCVAYNEKTNILCLIEIKRFGLGEIPESGEQLLRALTEIITYRAGFERILKDGEAISELQKSFEKAQVKIDLRNVKVVNCIFAPKSMYGVVDDRIKEFLNSTEIECYKTQLYSITPHPDITQHPIGCGRILFDIDSVSL